MFAFILVGFPGSGKTTWVKNNITQSTMNFKILSTDNIIESLAENRGLTYSEAFPKYIDFAQSMFFEQFRECVKNKENFVIDRTNLTITSRKKFLSQLPVDYYKIAIVFSCDNEELEKRLNSRPGKTIPTYVIENMKRNYQMPTSLEGFNEIINFNTTGEDIIG